MLGTALDVHATFIERSNRYGVMVDQESWKTADGGQLLCHPVVSGFRSDDMLARHPARREAEETDRPLRRRPAPIYQNRLPSTHHSDFLPLINQSIQHTGAMLRGVVVRPGAGLQLSAADVALAIGRRRPRAAITTPLDAHSAAPAAAAVTASQRRLSTHARIQLRDIRVRLTCVEVWLGIDRESCPSKSTALEHTHMCVHFMQAWRRAQQAQHVQAKKNGKKVGAAVMN